MVQEGFVDRVLLHWVRVDLSASGIELYVTPLDPEAVAQGRQYRLRGIAEVVQREQLAVASTRHWSSITTTKSTWALLLFSDVVTRRLNVMDDNLFVCSCLARMERGRRDVRARCRPSHSEPIPLVRFMAWQLSSACSVVLKGGQRLNASGSELSVPEAQWTCAANPEVASRPGHQAAAAV
jgi:hypothetical protein